MGSTGVYGALQDDMRGYRLIWFTWSQPQWLPNSRIQRGCLRSELFFPDESVL